MSLMSIALELLLATLLAGCLFYCWRLDRKLSALRNSEAGIRAAAAELNRAIAQAEIAIKGLRAQAQEPIREARARIEVASEPVVRPVARRGLR
jgi:hypothetical protein